MGVNVQHPTMPDGAFITNKDSVRGELDTPGQNYTFNETLSMNGQKTGNAVLDLYLEKLAYFEKELATISDKAMKFSLKKEIEEIRKEVVKHTLNATLSMSKEEMGSYHSSLDRKVNQIIKLEDIEIANKMFKRFNENEIDSIYTSLWGSSLRTQGEFKSHSHRVIDLLTQAKEKQVLNKLCKSVLSLEPDFLEI